MRLSIVIASFNTRELLERALRSIEAHAPRAGHETIVVDNASADGSADMVAARFPGVRLVRNPANLGFAAASNRALALARGEYVFLMNSDAELVPRTLDRLVDALDADPTIGIVGPTERLADGTRYPTICPFPGLVFVVLSHLGLRRRFNRSRLINPIRAVWERAQASGEPVDVDWLSGASLLVRRAVLDEAAGFDEGFFFYMEETDLCRRARGRGWRVVFVPSAEIIHHGGASTDKAAGGLLTLAGALSELRYFDKHAGPVQRGLLRALLLAEHLLRLLVSGPGDPRRRAHREVLKAVVGRRDARVGAEDLCPR